MVTEGMYGYLAAVGVGPIVKFQHKRRRGRMRNLPWYLADVSRDYKLNAIDACPVWYPYPAMPLKSIPRRCDNLHT